jgi:phospholipid N-methyltransferase
MFNHSKGWISQNQDQLKKVEFLIQSIKNFQEMGSIVRSGTQMCKKMSKFVPKHKDVVIVELGAGDGAITQFILDRMSEGSKLIAFEINPDLYDRLIEINDPRLIIINEGAQNLPDTLKSHGLNNVDMVISAIPFLVLPEDLTKDILQKSKNALKVGGTFVQMHYALTLKKMYEDLFGNIDTFFVPLNIPPGYVFKCVKEA